MITVKIKYPINNKGIDFDRLDGIDADVFDILIDKCHIDRNKLSVKYEDDYEVISIDDVFDVSELDKIELLLGEEIKVEVKNEKRDYKYEY